MREHTAWEGRPSWRGLAVGLFRMHLVALYFILLALGRTVLALRGGASLQRAMPPAISVLIFGAGCLALLGLLAWAVRRTTLYRITDRRIILQYGVAISATLAIPYGAVAEVALRGSPGRLHGPGGDISVRLKPGQSIGYVRLWPHARPWHLATAQPMLRAVPDAASVAAILVRLTQAGVSRIAEETERDTILPGHEADLVEEAPRAVVRSAAPG